MRSSNSKAFSLPERVRFPPNTIFTRDAYVGLSNDKYGSIWFGRAMSLTDETGWYLDPLGEQVGTGIANFAFGRAWGPRSNVVTYNSPTWAGFSFRVQDGFGNAARQFPGRTSVQCERTVHPHQFCCIRSVRRTPRRQRQIFKPLCRVARIHGWRHLRNRSCEVLRRLSATGLLRAGHGRRLRLTPTRPHAPSRSGLAPRIRQPPALALQAGWYHGNVNHGGGEGNLGAIGTTYNLSKRTFLYLTVGAMFNGKPSAFPVETADSQPLPGHNQQGGYFGIMHFF